ncbi:MAG: multidrug ABC transporter substrate-binding protein [Acidobacteria bacterium]|nr:MAG: multidrug ABC transporter substrate-binding protein [Acidobacteriota bacterium]REK11096.1 MAG: multidrug ABC transporter substrate-binding protein [Acidobacteriota bacterium]
MSRDPGRRRLPSGRPASDVPRPPRLSEAVVSLLLGGGETRHVALGDLREDYVRQVDLRGAFAARWWYRLEALDLCLQMAWNPFRTADPPASLRRGGAADRQLEGATTMDWIEALSPRGLGHDLRSALRAVRRDPKLLAFATVITGVGIGATTAVFSVLQPLLIEPLPFEEPERLVWIANVDGDGGGLSSVTSRTGNLRDFRAMTDSFDGLSGWFAFFERSPHTLSGDGEPETLIGVDVAHDLLAVLGVDPVIGRHFRPDEARSPDGDVVILSHDFWERRFGGDEGIVGRTVTIDDRPQVVVGVLPAEFDFSSVFTPNTRVDFLCPFPIDDSTDAWGNTLHIVGRLADDATVESAQADLDRVVAALAEADPRRWGLGGEITPLRERISGPYRPALVLLAASAAVMMLIVCANLANYLLARGARRVPEISLRSTLGASRGRIVRQLVLESLLLALCGSLLGGVLAAVATRWIAQTSAISIPMLSSVSVNGTTLVFCLFVAALVGLLVGVAPASHLVGRRPALAAHASVRGASSGRSARGLRETLVVAEVALACVLLVFGGLLLESFQRVSRTDLGFDAEGVVAWRIRTPARLQGADDVESFHRELIEAVASSPGVSSVALTDDLPLGGNRSWGIAVPGVVQDEPINAFVHLVDAAYLDTLEIPLAEGRPFTAGDDRESAPVAIVNQSLASRLYDGSALGRELRFGHGVFEVVGVAADVLHQSAEQESGLQVYLPLSQLAEPPGQVEMVVRSTLPPSSLVPQVRATIVSVDPTLPSDEHQTLASRIDRASSPRRFTLTLLAAFAAIAVLLASLGIYGVLSHSVIERSREIGIRMALGEARRRVVARLVLRTALLALVGVLLGAAATVPLSRLVSNLLFGIHSSDPGVLATTAAILVLVAVVAALFPALRAARTDCAVVLRRT